MKFTERQLNTASKIIKKLPLKALAMAYQGHIKSNSLLSKLSRFVAFKAMQTTNQKLILIDGGLIGFLDDNDVSLRAFVLGNYEVEALREVFAKLGNKQYLNFIDIGANIGLSTIAASQLKMANSFIAIEPDPKNYEILVLNLALNHVSQSRTIQAAVSSHNGISVLEHGAGDSGDHRIRTKYGLSNSDYFELREESKRKTSLVKTITLSSVVDSLVDSFIKIDVQGHEGFIFAGAEEVIRRDKSDIVFEFWPYGINRSGNIEAITSIVNLYGGAYDCERRIMLSGGDLENLLESHKSDLWFSNLVLSETINQLVS